MTKVRNTKVEPGRAAVPNASRSGSTKSSKRVPRPIADVAVDRRNRDDWVQMSFRAPAAVEEFVMTMCVKRKVTFQTLILELLRDLGAPISDADLQDNRKGRKAAPPNRHGSQTLKSKPFAKARDAIAALDRLGDPHLWQRISQQGNGQSIDQLPSTLQVIFANFVGDKAR